MKKSTVAKAAPPAVRAVAPQRITPSQPLTELEQHIWDSVISSHPAGFFEPCHVHMLEEYCKAITQSRVVDKLILEINLKIVAKNDYELNRYRTLQTLKSQIVRDASSLATRLRITKQAISEVKSARMKKNAPALGDKAPWE